MQVFPQAEIFRAVVDHLDAGVYVVDRERKIVHWNHGAEAVTGYLSQEMVGRVCGDKLLVHCDEQNKELCSVDCLITDALRDGTVHEADIYLRHRAGYRVPVRVRVVPLGNEEGRIVGAATGTVLVANPLHILKKIAQGMGGIFSGSKYTKQRYLEALKMMYDLLNKARKEGLVSLEADVEEPEKSPLFSKYPVFLKAHHVRDFVCDTMRMAVSGGIEPFDMDQMMDSDMEVHHHDAGQPVNALSTMADSLPGLGIVAAVWGVVITMGALGGPPEEIGHKGCGCPGRNVSGPAAVLWAGGAPSLQHGESRGRRTCVLAGAASADPGVSEGDCADHGGGDRSPGDSGTRAADLPGSGKDLPWRRGFGRCGGRRIISACRTAGRGVIKKGTHGGHHGGASKVVYADYVTVMMGLFIVLWLMNSSKQIQVAVGGYFKDPTGTSKKVGSNMPGSGQLFCPVQGHAEA
jgi:PAS domain S-box-containing protein